MKKTIKEYLEFNDAYDVLFYIKKLEKDIRKLKKELKEK